MTKHSPGGATPRRNLIEGSAEAAAILAHELGTPLASIRGLAAVLERYGERMSAAERVEFAGRIVRQSERATRLARMYLQPPGDDARQGDQDADAHATEPCQPAQVLTAVVEECSLLLGARSLDTEVMISDVRRVDAGADAVHRIVLNLVDNAAKFAAPSTTIGVSVRADREAVAIAITSTGQGIDSGQISVMFEPGGRLPRPVEADAPGTGLGLAIVADLVASAGGSVRVNTDGSRTTVIVALPAVAETGGAASQLSQSASLASSGA